jgi:ribosomal protein S18 acetylase RimI-like enzyme
VIDLPAIDGALTALVSGSAVEELQVLLERCADFEILLTGEPPGPTAAEDLLVDRPEDHPLRDKFVIGVWTDQGLTAAIDLLRHFPQEHVWYVGLLLVAPESRGQGLGARVVEALVDWVRRQGGRALRLVVQDENPRALAFWRARDFQPIGTAVQELEARTHQVTRMERRI